MWRRYTQTTSTYAYGQMTIQRGHQWNMADQFDVVKNQNPWSWFDLRRKKKNTRLDSNSWFWFISDIHSSVYIMYITYTVSPTKYTCSKDVAMDKRVASWLTLFPSWLILFPSYYWNTPISEWYCLLCCSFITWYAMKILMPFQAIFFEVLFKMSAAFFYICLAQRSFLQLTIVNILLSN